MKFLGYTLLPEGGIRIADKSIKRLKQKVKEITKRNRGVSFEELVKELNYVIIGWSNYFSLANKWLAVIRDIDGWIRRKLRCYKLKQCGKRFAIFKLLRSLEIPVNTSWNVVMYSQGWWQMSNKTAVRPSGAALSVLKVTKVIVNRNRRGTKDVCQVVWGDSGASRFLPD